MADTTLAPVVEQIILLMAQCVQAFVNKPDGKQAHAKKAGDYADEVANLLSEAKKTIDSIQYTIIAGKYAELLETFEELESKMGKKFARIRYHQDARKLKAKIRKHIHEIKTATTHADTPGGFDPHLIAKAETLAFAEKLKMEVIGSISLSYLQRNDHRACMLPVMGLGVVNAFMGFEMGNAQESVLRPEVIMKERQVPPIDPYEFVPPTIGPSSYMFGRGGYVDPTDSQIPLPTPVVMPTPGINMPDPHYS